MTFAPDALRDARSLLIAHLDVHDQSRAYPADLDPGEVGISGDAPHAAAGTSYHLGADDLRDGAYSARTARDRAGLTDAASAVDVGEFKATTPKGTFTHRDLAQWSVKQCRANHPDTRDIREIIYSPDGQRVFRYDRERGHTSRPTERIPADNHRTHNHYSQYRDATKAARRTLFDHFRRWLTEIGLIGDDMSTWASQVIESWSRGVDKTAGGKTVEPVKWRIRDEAWQKATSATLDALLAAVKGDADAADIKAHIDAKLAEMDAGLDRDLAELRAGLAQDILAALPDGPFTRDDLAAALVQVLGSLDGATPES